MKSHALFVAAAAMIASGVALQLPASASLGAAPAQTRATATGCTVVRAAAPSAGQVPDSAMATLEQLRGGTWTPVASTALDANGRFSFGAPPAGEYRICAQGPAETACRTPMFRAPAAGGTLTTSATCPAPANSDLAPAVLNVQLTPTTIGGDCATCGKSVTTSKNNAR